MSGKKILSKRELAFAGSLCGVFFSVVFLVSVKEQGFGGTIEMVAAACFLMVGMMLLSMPVYAIASALAQRKILDKRIEEYRQLIERVKRENHQMEMAKERDRKKAQKIRNEMQKEIRQEDKIRKVREKYRERERVIRLLKSDDEEPLLKALDRKMAQEIRDIIEGFD